MDGEERVVAASLSTKLQGRASRLMPDSVKAQMHRKMAEPGRPSREGRRRRRHRQRRDERAARARRRRDRRLDRRHRAARPRAVAAEDGVAQADVTRDELEPLFRGADAVVHLAWLIQPSRDDEALRAVNVEGSRRVFEAAGAAGAGALVYASSVGAYSPGPKDRRGRRELADRRHPTPRSTRATRRRWSGCWTASSSSTRDALVRLRPGLIFKREAASGIRRLFAGPLLPNPLVRPAPDPRRAATCRGCVFQAVHSRTSARPTGWPSSATCAARSTSPPTRCSTPTSSRGCSARGGAGAPRRAARGGGASWRAAPAAHAEPGWVDMALGVPLMDTTRAREELGWTPRHRRRRAARAARGDPRRRRLRHAAAAAGRLAPAGAQAGRRRAAPIGCRACSPPSSAATPSPTG